MTAGDLREEVGIDIFPKPDMTLHVVFTDGVEGYKMASVGQAKDDWSEKQLVMSSLS